MQREVNIFDVDVVSFFQLFNTPGTEIAPGSNKIGINIKGKWFRHRFLQGWNDDRVAKFPRISELINKK